MTPDQLIELCHRLHDANMAARVQVRVTSLELAMLHGRLDPFCIIPRSETFRTLMGIPLVEDNSLERLVFCDPGMA